MNPASARGGGIPVMGARGAEESLPDIDGITLTETTVLSSIDRTDQPVIVGVPDGYDPATPTPLLVGLHTWSADYRQRAQPYGRQAAERGWLLVLPNFRGPNRASNPHARQAGGSLLAQHDIVDARKHMVEQFNVNEDRAYITGDSGGGHMTLLMVGKYPDLWSAAAAWCPVTDLREWWAETSGYAPHIQAVCGGKPGESPEVDFEYARRSPRTFMTNLAHVPVLLAHGDGDRVIPVEQTWRTFRVLGNLPTHNTLLHVFSAGHSGRHGFGLDWCEAHAATPGEPRQLHLVTDESKSYYWTTLQMADETRLATADIVTGSDVLSVATENLQHLTLDLRWLPHGQSSMTLAIRCDGPLRLVLEGLTAGASVRPENRGIARLERPRTPPTLAVEPAEEMRSVTLAWSGGQG